MEAYDVILHTRSVHTVGFLVHRSVKMQHVLPSRNVCVAYHGMTIPLPAPSLCGTFHKPLLIGKVNERGLKDSGFNSQATTVSEVSCSTASVSTSPGGAGLCSRQWKGDERKEEEEKIQVEKCDKSCKIEPALTYSASACCLSECISTETRYPTLLLPDKKAENPLSKSVWAGTGRGRALQQFVSQLTHRPAGISGAYDNGITDLRHCIKEAADAITRGGVIKAEHMSAAEDVDISCGSSVTSSSPVDQPSENIMIESRAVSDMKYEDPASPVELMGESNNTTESVDIMPSSVSCAEFGPEKEIEEQITTPVRTDESQPLLSRSISHVPHNSVTKTPSRSSRKSKVSLAIQFKGTCTLQSVSQRDSLLTLRPLEETPQGVMLCDLQSPSTRISEVAVKAEEVAAEEDPEEMAMVSETPDHTEGPVKDVGKKREECELKDGESPEVSGVEDRGQGPIDSYALSGSDVEVDSLESRVEETLGLSGHHLGLVRSLSSDEDMVECAEARMGRGANELEKSIALHQRNIHRNRVCVGSVCTDDPA